MPLHAECAVGFYGLDQAVVAPRGRTQLAGIEHGLVVDRVDLHGAGERERGNGARVSRHGVDRLVLAVADPVAVVAGGGKVLMQRSARRDRHHLDAPTDAEHSPSALARREIRPDLERVTRGIDLVDLGRGRGRVTRRVDVTAAAEQQRIGPGDRFEQMLARGRGRRHHPGHATDRRDRVHIPAVHRKPVRGFATDHDRDDGSLPDRHELRTPTGTGAAPSRSPARDSRPTPIASCRRTRSRTAARTLRG